MSTMEHLASSKLQFRVPDLLERWCCTFASRPECIVKCNEWGDAGKGRLGKKGRVENKSLSVKYMQQADFESHRTVPLWICDYPWYKIQMMEAKDIGIDAGPF